MPRFSLCAFFAVVVLQGVALGDTNLMVNGGFETFATSGTGITSYNGGKFYSYNGGTSGVQGWTVGGVCIDLTATSYWTSQEGTWSVDLVGSPNAGTTTPRVGSLSQSVPGLIAGASYKLDFYHAVNPEVLGGTTDGTAPKILDIAVLDPFGNPIVPTATGAGVILGNNHVQYTVPIGTRTLQDMQWINDDLFFNATASSATIVFSAVAGSPPPTYAGPTIDNVGLFQVAAPVPEAGTVFMLAVGVGGLLGRRRR